MRNRFREIAAEMATREYGGAIPEDVLAIARRAEEEMRAVVAKHCPQAGPEAAYMVALAVAEIAIQVAAEVLHRERNWLGGPEWHNGFGSVSKWETPETGGEP